jgi:hypothetical protein
VNVPIVVIRAVGSQAVTTERLGDPSRLWGKAATSDGLPGPSLGQSVGQPDRSTLSVAFLAVNGNCRLPPPVRQGPFANSIDRQ